MPSCNIVRDLLPLHLEQLTSSETNAEILAHLEVCEGCRDVRDAMSTDLPIERAPKSKLNFLKKLKRKQIISAVLSVILTLFCMYGLYSMEFSVDVTDTAAFEAAIDEYFFTESVDADIIESHKVGNRLIVFFEREGYSGHYGTAILEPGFFGKYRFTSANLSTWSLYNLTTMDSGGKHYLILFGIYEPAGAAEYAVYPSDDTSQPPIYRGTAEKAPFFRVIETEESGHYSVFEAVHYYDADGNEIDRNNLWDEAPEAAEGTAPGVGSAELFLVYVYMIIALLLGVTSVRYFIKP